MPPICSHNLVIRPFFFTTPLRQLRGSTKVRHNTRNFISPPVQHLSAQRTLQYPSQPIYEIIAAVPAYSAFLPYCLSSTVTRWSGPDAEFQRRWPEEAVLEIGWGSMRERFRSRIYCVPGRIVEAVGGAAQTQLAKADIAHHDVRLSASIAAENGGPTKQDEEDGILTHLATRWTVKELDPKRTNVALDIEFQFANPVYAAMSGAVAGRVADVLIEAFEKRVKTELERGEAETRAVMEEALKSV